MPRTTFDTLPTDARLWIFAAERELTSGEREAVLGTVDQFLDHWQAHGHPLTSARDLRHDRFLLIAVDEAAAGASGCSIDALVRDIKRIEASLGLALVDHGPVLFRNGDTIARVPRDEFSDLVRTGVVTPQTIVFNNTLTRVGDVRAGRWEVPAAQSWHAAAFF
jgi:hypothetical protein